MCWNSYPWHPDCSVKDCFCYNLLLTGSLPRTDINRGGLLLTSLTRFATLGWADAVNNTDTSYPCMV